MSNSRSTLTTLDKQVRDIKHSVLQSKPLCRIPRKKMMDPKDGALTQLSYQEMDSTASSLEDELPPTGQGMRTSMPKSKDEAMLKQPEECNPKDKVKKKKSKRKAKVQPCTKTMRKLKAETQRILTRRSRESKCQRQRTCLHMKLDNLFDMARMEAQSMNNEEEE